MKKPANKNVKPKDVHVKQESTIDILAREIIKMSKKLKEISSIVEKLRGRMGL